MKFTSIDFEKATNNSISICSVGISVFEDDKICFSNNWLVKPPGNEYLELHKSIHGISEEDTCNSPTFPEIWDEIRPFLENQIVIAHNGSTVEFPILETLLGEFRLPWIQYYQVCTLQLSNLLFPFLQNHKLSTVCKMMGIDFNAESYHNSQYDAEKCGEVFIKMKNFFNLDESFYPDNSVKKKSETNKSFANLKYKKVKSEFINPTETPLYANHFFFQKKVVITGEFSTFYKDRNRLAEILFNCGADINHGISKKTDIVIVGSGAGPKKLEKISELNIPTIFEDELLELIKEFVNG